MKMPDEAKVYPATDDLVETAYSGQESDQECKVYDENQVPLVMTFSKRKALHEFRCKVEDAIQRNYIFGREMETFTYTQIAKAKEHLKEPSLWGVPLLPSKGHESTDVIFMKFLEAKDYKVSDAFSLLQRTLSWRMEMDIEGILHEKIGSDLDKVGHIGSTKSIKGHPLVYNSYGIYKDKEIYRERFESDDTYEDFLRWNIQFLERCVKTLDFIPGSTNSIIWIVDLKDAPAAVIKDLPILSRKFLTLFQDYYPGIIYRNIIINVPLWLLTFHALQLRSLTQRTRSKFIFVRPFSVTKTLLKFVAPENLPVQYGGLKREYEELFSSHVKITQQKLRPNSIECIQIPVPQAGMTIYWDISVVGYDVSYKEEFVPDDDCSYRILIQKEKRLGKSIRNSFHIREPGKIVLSIENATYKNKVAFYRYLIQPTVTNFTRLRKD